MPKYRFNGFGRVTGRKRCRTYVADTVEEAIQKACEDETVVDPHSVEISPEEPATERQLRFARELGLLFKADISKRKMRQLLDTALGLEWMRRIDENLPPTEAQLEFALELGIRVGPGIKRRQLTKMISEVIDDDWPIESAVRQTDSGLLGERLLERMAAEADEGKRKARGR